MKTIIDVSKDRLHVIDFWESDLKEMSIAFDDVMISMSIQQSKVLFKAMEKAMKELKGVK